MIETGDFKEKKLKCSGSHLCQKRVMLGGERKVTQLSYTHLPPAQHK